MRDLSINSDRSASYRPDIDGLRAIAILLVIFYHFNFSFVGAGLYGVDIFFVISGFLITGASLRSISSLRDVSVFFQRRAARILPTMAFVTIACVILWRIEFGPFLWREIRRATPSVALFFANIFYWKNLDYFRAVADTNPFVHTWSLSLEEQFYFVAPFLMLLTKKRRALLFVVSALSVATLFFAKTAGAFYLIPCRAWEFCAGAAMVYTARPTRRSFAAMAGIIGLLMIGAGLAIAVGSQEDSPFWRFLPVIGTAAIIWAGQIENLISRALSWRPAALIGRISYSTYLIHWPFWVFATLLAETPLTVLQRIALMAAVLVSSVLVFQFVEKPAQRLLRATSPKRALWTSVALVTMAALTPSLASKISAGGLFLDFDFDEFSSSGELGFCWLNLDQTKADYRVDLCVPKIDSRKRVMLWGNSFAAHYLRGLRSRNDEKYAIFQMSMSACPPSRMTGSDTRCNEFNSFVLEQTLNSAKPDLVILSANWTHSDEVGKWNRTIDEIHSVIAKLNEHGIRVLLVAQTPEFQFDVPLIVAKMPKPIPTEASFEAQTFNELNRALEAEATKSRVPFFNFGQVLCTNGAQCLAVSSGRALFLDKSHLTEFGSKLAAKTLLPLVTATLEADPK